MLGEVARSGRVPEMGRIPHRQFFDISELDAACLERLEGSIFVHSTRRNHWTSSLLPTPPGAPEYSPRTPEVHAVLTMLCNLGLPPEVSLQIIEYADYAPRGVLRIPNDPLCFENRDGLGKYLSYCWQLLLRCDMLARELNAEIMWDTEISECLVHLFSCPGERRIYKFDNYEAQENDRYNFK